MGAVKFEAKVLFPKGHIWVLMDDEWGVEVLGEDGVGGPLTGMGSWDFKTKEAWHRWGNICTDFIHNLKIMLDENKITEEVVTNRIYQLEDMMPFKVREQLVSYEESTTTEHLKTKVKAIKERRPRRSRGMHRIKRFIRQRSRINHRFRAAL